MAQLKELAGKIADIERSYALLPTSDLYKEKLLLQTEFNTLTRWKAEKNILKFRQVYYEHGDEVGRLLVPQLQQHSAEQMIPGIDTGYLTLYDAAPESLTTSLNNIILLYINQR